MGLHALSILRRDHMTDANIPFKPRLSPASGTVLGSAGCPRSVQTVGGTIGWITNKCCTLSPGGRSTCRAKTKLTVLPENYFNSY